MATERSKVDRELRKLGFGGLDDANLIPQIAFCIRGHEQFRSQLMSVTPDKRHLAYTQLRPHLRFTAKLLNVYEAEMKEIAEKQQWPTMKQGDVYPTPFKKPDVETLTTTANVALADEFTPPEKEKSLTLTCCKCLKEEQFWSFSRLLADVKASIAGWHTEGDKSWCPEHAPKVN